MSRPVTFEEVSLKILHPLHCIESKTVNLATLPQKDGDRQDLKHLRLSIAVFRRHLTKLTEDGIAEELLLRWARRLRTDANHELGLQATLKYGINFQDAIPEEIWRTKPGPLADFINIDCRKWAEEIREKTTDIRELESWLKSLGAKSK
jgi:hypothetical protein